MVVDILIIVTIPITLPYDWLFQRILIRNIGRVVLLVQNSGQKRKFRFPRDRLLPLLVGILEGVDGRIDFDRVAGGLHLLAHPDGFQQGLTNGQLVLLAGAVGVVDVVDKPAGCLHALFHNGVPSILAALATPPAVVVVLVFEAVVGVEWRGVLTEEVLVIASVTVVRVMDLGTLH